MKELKNRVAVVTGAGSGIGRATSVLLAQRGCRLAIADVNAPGLDETKAAIERAGAKVSCHIVDVSKREQVQRFVEEVLAAHGGVNILINNAGVSVGGRFADQSLEDFEWLFGVNFWGVVYGCRLFLPALLAAEEGHIVNISSIFGLVGVADQSSYCASKFAVLGLSESLLAELRETRVRVSCVHPGGVATNIAVTARITDDDVARERHARFMRMLKKTLPPEKAAEVIVRGIEREQPRVLITRETHVLDIVKRVFPSGASALVRWSAKRMSQ